MEHSAVTPRDSRARGCLLPVGARARFAFPFKSLLKKGIVISGGSDWPVGLYNPLIGLDILVNHRFGPEEKGEVLNSDERLTCSRLFGTYNGAFTAF